MGNPEHLEILKQGVEVWNQWREDNPNVKPHLSDSDLQDSELQMVNFFEVNLRKANLSKANLRGADLSYANLRGANLRKGDFTRASFIGANLSDANFELARLDWANLSQTDLSRTNFTSAYLRGIDLSWAYLVETKLNGATLVKAYLRKTILNEEQMNGADLSEAKMAKCNIGNINLSQARGLSSIRHFGPSTLGIDTLFISRGHIPESFLRGAGVPDTFIEYISSLSGEAFDYYSCFISHSSKDQDFAQQLYTDLQSRGVRCWFAPEDMRIGDRIRKRIDQSIRFHDKLLLIISENSINSEWCEDECEAASERENKEHSTVLFPVRIDEAIMDTDQAWAAKLRRSRHIGDFTNWKDHNAYKKAFDRLLRDLKAEG